MDYAEKVKRLQSFIPDWLTWPVENNLCLRQFLMGANVNEYVMPDGTITASITRALSAWVQWVNDGKNSNGPIEPMLPGYADEHTNHELQDSIDGSSFADIKVR